MSYANVAGHRHMVFDAVRNAAYVQALERVIGPESKVMDVGAGLGVLGLNAALLGAARVHLVEPEGLMDVARQVAQVHELQNVFCHQSRVEDLELNERVDVLLSVFTGNLLFGEDLLPSLFYARDHFLAPGGIMLPDRARLEFVPVSVPEYYSSTIDCWQGVSASAGGLDFSAVRSYAANTPYAENWSRLSPKLLAAPVALTELDLLSATEAACDETLSFNVSEPGVCHGWLGWFQIRLFDEWLNTSGENRETHWRPVFLPLEHPLSVEPDEMITVQVKRRSGGEWHWITAAGGHRQVQSSFLSEPVGLARLQRLSGGKR